MLLTENMLSKYQFQGVLHLDYKVVRRRKKTHFLYLYTENSLAWTEQ